MTNTGVGATVAIFRDFQMFSADSLMKFGRTHLIVASISIISNVPSDYIGLNEFQALCTYEDQMFSLTLD